MKLSILLLLLSFVSTTSLAYDEHTELALEFDRVSSSQDKRKLVRKSVLPMLFGQHPELKEEKRILEEKLLAAIQSEEFKLGKAKIYKKLFSVSELKSLIEWFSHPAYSIFNERRFEINQKLMEYSVAKYFEVAEDLSESL